MRYVLNNYVFVLTDFILNNPFLFFFGHKMFSKRKYYQNEHLPSYYGLFISFMASKRLL